MTEAFMDALVDSLKILPILFLTYLLMEFIEQKASEKTNAIVEKAGKAGPIVGGLFGLIPQCGFSAAAASLYAARVVTLGTLVSIFLTTSDEMLPILISSNISMGEILKILAIKFFIGVVCGLVIDFVLRGKVKRKMDIHSICEKEHCECGSGSIVVSALKHTINIIILIFIVIFALNIIISYAGEDTIRGFIWNKPIVGQFTAAIIGLIPNCFSSVMLTNLYVQNAMGFGAMISGLLVNSGIGLLVLFRMNDDIKENLKITALLYIIAVVSGIIIDI